MVVFVTGGSGCGKSAFAESVAQKLNKEAGARREENASSKASGEAGENRLIYVATMPIFNEDDLIKVERHHKLRAGKGFETLERPKLLTEIPGGGETVLVECMSTHTANMLYDPDLVLEDDKDGEKALAAIRKEIGELCNREGSTVFVSAEIALDGVEHDPEMEKYKRVMTAVNCFLMERADAAYEVVYGIPVALKGAKWEDGGEPS